MNGRTDMDFSPSPQTYMVLPIPRELGLGVGSGPEARSWRVVAPGPQGLIFIKRGRCGYITERKLLY